MRTKLDLAHAQAFTSIFVTLTRLVDSNLAPHDDVSSAGCSWSRLFCATTKTVFAGVRGTEEAETRFPRVRNAAGLSIPSCCQCELCSLLDIGQSAYAHSPTPYIPGTLSRPTQSLGPEMKDKHKWNESKSTHTQRYRRLVVAVYSRRRGRSISSR